MSQEESNAASAYNKPSIVIAVAHPTLFTPLELNLFEREILTNPNATELQAADFFTRFPKFLLQGKSRDLRREAVLLGPDNKPIGRVDFFRRSFGDEYWDLIELKHPKSRVIVGDKGCHPRLSSHISSAISQAEDYREWLRNDAAMREDLRRKGIVVNRPRLWIVAGRTDESVNENVLRRLRSRIEAAGVELSTYTDLFRFAKEHYQSTKVMISVATLHEVSWPVAEFRKDLQGRFIYVNKAFGDLFGKTIDEIIGKTDAELLPDSEQMKYFREHDRQVMETGNPSEIEEVIWDSSGRQAFVRTTKIPLRKTNGKIFGVTGIFKRLS